MAPGLEEEVVFQLMSETDNPRYMIDKLYAMRELGFKIDRDKVKTAVRRYKLLKEYNSPENHKTKFRDKTKARANEIAQKRIEVLEKDPQVLQDSFKVENKRDRRSLGHYCGKCHSRRPRTLKLEYKKMARIGQNFLEVFKIREDLFHYCEACGYTGIQL